MVSAYVGTGSPPYHPAMLVPLFHGYATRVFSSRKLAQETHDGIAFRYIRANIHSDHRTIADFRRHFVDELAALFTEMLLIAQAMGLLKLDAVSLDGTKLKADASKNRLDATTLPQHGGSGGMNDLTARLSASATPTEPTA